MDKKADPFIQYFMKIDFFGVVDKMIVTRP